MRRVLFFLVAVLIMTGCNDKKSGKPDSGSTESNGLLENSDSIKENYRDSLNPKFNSISDVLQIPGDWGNHVEDNTSILHFDMLEDMPILWRKKTEKLRFTGQQKPIVRSISALIKWKLSPAQ